MILKTFSVAVAQSFAVALAVSQGIQGEPKINQ
jgi:hypothetical protein